MRWLGAALRVAAVILGLGVVVVGTASPASADDCDARLKAAGVFEGLADEAVVEDCIRTGGSFGTTIGIIVGGVGAAIAAAGLPGLRKPPEKPGKGPEPEGNFNDCEHAYNLQPEIDGYLAEIQSFEQDIAQEWKVYLQGAQSLSRELQLMEQLDINTRGRHIAKATAKILTVAVLTELGGRVSGWAGAGAATGGAGAGAAGVGGAAAQGAARSGLIEMAKAGAPEAFGQASAHLGTDLFLDGDALYFGEANSRLDQIWSRYPDLVKRTMNFNQRMQNWADTREAQLNDAYKHANDLIDRYNDYVASCQAALRAAGNTILQPAVHPMSRLAKGPSRIDRLVVRPWLERRNWKTPLNSRSMSEWIADNSGLTDQFNSTYGSAAYPSEQMSAILPESWR